MREIQACIQFGGFDPVKVAAKLLLLCATREEMPGGAWNFDGDEEAREQYVKRLTNLIALKDAANRFIESEASE